MAKRARPQRPWQQQTIAQPEDCTRKRHRKEGPIDIYLLATAAVGVLVAGISKGGFGGGASFIAVPITALALPPGLALAVVLPLLIVMDAAALRAYWRGWSQRDATRLILGGLPGLLAGALLYRLADPDVFRLLIGAIAVAFVIWQLARARSAGARRRTLPSWVAVASSFGAGFTSFVAHAGGPILLIWLLAQGLDKRTFQATTVAVFAAFNLLKLGLYAGLGLFTTETLVLSASLAPVAVLGAWIGILAHSRMPARAFFAISYTLLLGAGAKLIHDGVVGLL